MFSGALPLWNKMHFPHVDGGNFLLPPVKMFQGSHEEA
jgi:hypothetical protein